MSTQENWTQEELEVEFPDLDRMRLLGRGGFAVVYEAEHPQLGLIALKVLTGSTDWNPSDATRDSFWTQVRVETRAIGSLSASPNIVTLHTSGVSSSGWPFLVMELCPGGSLRDLMHRQGSLRNEPFAEANVQEVGEALARALTDAHCRGVLHLDVKPANVLISRFGVYKLSDFGIARMLSDGSSPAREVFLTPHYAAPELWEDDAQPTTAADVYALGSTLYYLASRQRPFEGSSGAELMMRVRSESPRNLTTLGLTPNLSDLIHACLAKNPLDRPDAASLVEAFRSTGNDGDTTRTIPARPGREHGSPDLLPSDGSTVRASALRPPRAPGVDGPEKPPETSDRAAPLGVERPELDAERSSRDLRARWFLAAGVGLAAVLLAGLVLMMILLRKDSSEALSDEALLADLPQGLLASPGDSPDANDPSAGGPTGVRIGTVRDGAAVLSWEPLDGQGGAEYVVVAAYFPIDPDTGTPASRPVEYGLVSSGGDIASEGREFGRWSAGDTTVEVPVDLSGFTCFKPAVVTGEMAIPSAEQACAPTAEPAAPVIEAVNVDATDANATVNWSESPGQQAHFRVMSVVQRDEHFEIVEVAVVPVDAPLSATLPYESGSCFVVRAENATNTLPSDLTASALTDSPSQSNPSCPGS